MTEGAEAGAVVSPLLSIWGGVVENPEDVEGHEGNVERVLDVNKEGIGINCGNDDGREEVGISVRVGGAGRV